MTIDHITDITNICILYIYTLITIILVTHFFEKLLTGNGFIFKSSITLNRVKGKRIKNKNNIMTVFNFIITNQLKYY